MDSQAPRFSGELLLILLYPLVYLLYSSLLNFHIDKASCIIYLKKGWFAENLFCIIVLSFQECKRQFKNRRYNCETVNDDSVFGPITSLGKCQRLKPLCITLFSLPTQLYSVNLLSLFKSLLSQINRLQIANDNIYPAANSSCHSQASTFSCLSDPPDDITVYVNNELTANFPPTYHVLG